VLRGAGRLTPQMKTFQYVNSGSTEVKSAQFEEFQPSSGNLHVVLATVGAKFNPFGSLLVSANVIVPMTRSGLRSRVGTVVGVDWAF
jgi:hypothetical protein